MRSKKIQNPKFEIRNQGDAFEQMNRMYRHQRFFYDLTRKYYLLGRDRLLNKINVQPDENVLEIGCGTGRNLIILAKKFPNAHFFGLDASSAMLVTAQKKIAARKLKNINLKTALADDFNHRTIFDLENAFDTIFFSYSISMILTWRKSIVNALANLKPGGKLYIVDFYDQADLPALFQRILTGWLKQFHVRYPKDLIPFLENLQRQGKGEMNFTPLYRRYSFIAEFKKL